jgi:GNAT superfamily N-acetyltransferase
LGSAAVFVAERERDWVGVAVGRWHDREGGVAQLSGLWVDPALRSRGLGARLLDEVDSWAAVNGARLLRLGIIVDGPDVEGFYTRLGFARTGETRPLSFDASRTARFLARPVPGV